MIDRLLIAEKPKMAQAIAACLPGPREKKGTHIVCGGGWVVTWCVGHILEMAPPDAYGEQYASWNFESLPIWPHSWKLVPVRSAISQLRAIEGLLKTTKTCVVAGDPDREGQLLVQEVLLHLGSRHPALRLWVQALDEKSVKKALGDLRDNREYEDLYQSALARSRADWLVGMNMSRAFTLAAKRCGSDRVLSVGRVQTPTLEIIVRRDLEIENFKPVDYFVLKVRAQVPKGEFDAVWKPLAGQSGLDADGRLLDRKIADALVAKVRGKSGQVSGYKVERESEGPPLPFSLSSLQVFASGSWGMGAQMVLDICQSLYETHMLTTYPRTDSEYLPESQLAEAAEVLQSVARTDPSVRELASGADLSRKSSAWNDKKVTAHHGIIPTTRPGNIDALSPAERKIYGVIVQRYLAQFYPDHIYQQTSVVVTFEGEHFAASGRTTMSPGWKKVFGAEETDAKDDGEQDAEEGKQTLPPMAQGDPAKCVSANATASRTKPPAHYTDGTLIRAMKNAHQFVADPELKKRLKDTAGIGTEATRAAIMETLLKRGFIQKNGKHLISTETGRILIAALPKELTDPGTTALWESVLDAIATGKVEPDAFLGKLKGQIAKLLDYAKSVELNVPSGGGAARPRGGRTSGKGKSAGRSQRSSGATGGEACPKCGKGSLVERTVRNGSNAGKRFKGCTNYPTCNYSEWPK